MYVAVSRSTNTMLWLNDVVDEENDSSASVLGGGDSVSVGDSDRGDSGGDSDGSSFLFL